MPAIAAACPEENMPLSKSTAAAAIFTSCSFMPSGKSIVSRPMFGILPNVGLSFLFFSYITGQRLLIFFVRTERTDFVTLSGSMVHPNLYLCRKNFFFSQNGCVDKSNQNSNGKNFYECHPHTNEWITVHHVELFYFMSFLPDPLQESARIHHT